MDKSLSLPLVALLTSNERLTGLLVVTRHEDNDSHQSGSRTRSRQQITRKIQFSEPAIRHGPHAAGPANAGDFDSIQAAAQLFRGGRVFGQKKDRDREHDLFVTIPTLQ